MGIETNKYSLNNRYYFKYQTKELNGLSHLTGKAIIHFKKDFRASYLIGRKYEDLLYIKELRHQRKSEVFSWVIIFNERKMNKLFTCIISI